MPVADIISLIDAHISLLQKVRGVLVDDRVPARRAGRKKVVPEQLELVATVEAEAAEPARAPEPEPVPVVVVPTKRTRTLSLEGRRRIQEAQRQRWAERKKEKEAEPDEPEAPKPAIALTSAVPAGPVAVSAQEVQKAMARRTQAETPPTPQLTAQDWMNYKPSPQITFDMLFEPVKEKSTPAPETPAEANS
jgi:hypothetical protein